MAAPAPCLRRARTHTSTARPVQLFTCDFAYCPQAEQELRFTLYEAYRVKRSQGFFHYCSVDCYMQVLCLEKQGAVLRDNAYVFGISHWDNEDHWRFQNVVLNRVNQIRETKAHLKKQLTAQAAPVNLERQEQAQDDVA